MRLRKQFKSVLSGFDRAIGVRDWLNNGDAPESRSDVREPTYPFTTIADSEYSAPGSVIDIGANKGQFAREVFRHFGNVPVYSFEPIPECFDALEVLATEFSSLTPLQVALSDHAGIAEFFVSAFNDSSSLQRMLSAHLDAWPHTVTERKIQVRLERLDDMADSLSLAPPILAKLDVQGHELKVIRGGVNTLARCDRVMVECNFAPLYNEQPTFDALYSELKSLGFMFDGFMNLLRHPKTCELLSADALFFKPRSELLLYKNGSTNQNIGEPQVSCDRGHSDT